MIYSYPPVLGGSEIEAQRVAQALIARGSKITILCAGGDPMPPLQSWTDPYGVPVRLLAGNVSARFRPYIYALQVAWLLWKDRRHYDIAYFLMQGSQLVTGLPVARLAAKPIVMKFSCSSLVAVMTESLAGRLSLNFLRRWADRILILNPEMRQECAEVQFDPDKVSWMPNPVNVEEFRPCPPAELPELRRSLGLPVDEAVILFVGRLDHQKKIPWILNAFALVHRERPGAILALVGDGPLREEMQNKAKELGILSHVRFVGRQPIAGVLKWMQACDMSTLISEVEGLPCVLIEAMAAGLPPVVSDISAHTQLIEHEVHGLLTELGSASSVAQAMIRLIDDPALRATLGANARQRMIREFSTSHVADCYETLFAEVSGK